MAADVRGTSAPDHCRRASFLPPGEQRKERASTGSARTVVGGAVMRIGIIGGGAWGTALAQVAAEGGEVVMWAREPEGATSVNAPHENVLFLPGIRLDASIRATGALDELADCAALLVVTPAQHMRATLA